MTPLIGYGDCPHGAGGAALATFAAETFKIISNDYGNYFTGKQHFSRAQFMVARYRFLSR
jgi:hypothetical protein